MLLGEPWKVLTASEYHACKPELLGLVLDALADLRRRFDVVVCEGAGSPAEINLLDHDLVNLRVADEAGMAAILVGDINPGGVFAALYGTVALLPDHLRARVRGLVINKLRGDPALLLDGCEQLAARTGVPVVGVIPWLDVTGLDAEDSMALDRPRHRAGEPRAAGEALADELDVAVVRFPTISNFTDLDPLTIEPGVRVRFVHDRAGLGDPDLIVLPGTKATVADLGWLRARGLAAAITAGSAPVLAICGGYQMLGRTIDDGVESGAGQVDGLDVLPVDTCFEARKVTLLRAGSAGGHHVRRVPDPPRPRARARRRAVRGARRRARLGGGRRAGGPLVRHHAARTARARRLPPRLPRSASPGSGARSSSAPACRSPRCASRPSTPWPTRWPSTSTWPPSTR